MTNCSTTEDTPARRSAAARVARGAAATVGTGVLIWLLKMLLQYLQDSATRKAHARKARDAARKIADEAAARAAEAKHVVQSGVTAMKHSTRPGPATAATDGTKDS